MIDTNSNLKYIKKGPRLRSSRKAV